MKFASVVFFFLLYFSCSCQSYRTEKKRARVPCQRNLSGLLLYKNQKKYIKKRSGVFGSIGEGRPYVYCEKFKKFSIIKIVALSKRSTHLSTFWFVANNNGQDVKELPIMRWHFKEFAPSEISDRIVRDSIQFIIGDSSRQEFRKYIVETSEYYKKMSNK